MKILIIGIPRSGTTSLMKGIGKILNLKVISEPFALHSKEPKLKNFTLPENVVVKTMATHLPKDYKGTCINFNVEFSKKFDHVILLSRANKKEQMESMYNVIDSDENTSRNLWHSHYTMDKEIPIEQQQIWAETYDRWNNSLQSISTLLKKPIIWYEKLYSGNKNSVLQCIKELPKDISYDNLKKYIDPKKKYRIYTKVFI